MPSSTGRAFWQQDGPAQHGTSAVTPPYAQTPTAADGVSGTAEPQQQQSTAGSAGNQQQQQQWQDMAPPLRTGQAAWQQPPQQLLMRPVQQLPLLPHLAKPWVKQQTLRFKQDQEQQLHESGSMGQPDLKSSRSLVLMSQKRAQDRSQGTATASHLAEMTPRGPISLSGKVVPPLPVLLHRALEIEEQLLKSDAK
jgi:hypothetical protein